MSKSSVVANGAEGKKDLLLFDPEKLTLVTDEASPLYDPRVHLPINEAMVLNIMHCGVLQAVLVAKNPETGNVEVVAGRQRVKNCREANRRLIAKGCEPHQIPAVVRKGTASDQAGVMVSENELRDPDTPIGRAEKMLRLVNLGKSDEQVAMLFGVTKATVKNHLAMLDCTTAVRQAVSSGEIGVGHALALSKLPPEQQREKVAELKQVAGAATGHDRARKQRSIVTPDARPKMRSRKEVEDAHAKAEGPTRDALAWVLGIEAATP